MKSPTGSPSEDVARLATAHPWHGVSVGPDAPHLVTAFIEIVPTDVMKYEIDKESGLLRVDRPNKLSSQCPTLYGFLPQTLSDSRVAALCETQTNRKGIRGDQDPLDICVFSERPIQHAPVLVTVVPIGGLRILDRDEADDKIIAVLHQDAVYGSWTDVTSMSPNLLERLQHYFLSYKQMPGDSKRKVELTATYGADEARSVISASVEDYRARFGNSLSV